MSLRVAEMVGGVRVFVAVEWVDGSWAGCVRGAGLGAISEGMGVALMVVEVEVPGWVLSPVYTVTVTFSWQVFRAALARQT